MEKERQDLRIDFGKVVNTIKTECVVENPFTGHSGRYTATWDTGAVKSVVSMKVVHELGLPVIGDTVCFVPDGCSQTSVHSMNVILPNGDRFDYLRPSLHAIDDDVLIGMDIISQGDFHISNRDGRTVFTFSRTGQT